MSNSSHPRRRFALESLEPRLALAGNVTAQVSGGTLFLTGDAANNSIEFSQPAAVSGRYVITGTPDITGAPTTVNGQPAVVVTGVSNSVIAHLREGDDSITIVNGTVNRDLVITTEGGNDDVIVGSEPTSAPTGPPQFVFPPSPPLSVHIGGALNVNTGVGDDIVDEIAVAVRFSNVIDTGPGLDEVFLGPEPMAGVAPNEAARVQTGVDLVVNTGDGDDFTQGIALRVGGSFRHNDPSGINEAFIGSLIVGRDAFVITGSERDIVTLVGIRSNLLHVNTLGGDDDVTINDSIGNLLHVFLSGGNDRLSVGASRANREALFDGGSGFDTFVDLGGNFFARQRRVNFE
jgi:hypothetical protein